jgi:hypothetical protein
VRAAAASAPARARAALLAVVLAASLAGCVTPPRPLYAWGSYQELVYAAYKNPGETPPERQVELLEKDYQQALSVHARMPPGWHAHLGVLYYQLGKPDEAVRELDTEKAEFPESTVFVDRLLANARGKP